jgi:hypothetical protein
MKSTSSKVLFVSSVLFILCTTFIHPKIIKKENLHKGSCGDKYIVYLEAKNTLVITDMETMNIRRKRFDHEITGMELCPSYPFIHLKFSGMSRVRDEIKYFIYDLEMDRMYGDFPFSRSDTRWSKDGAFTYFSKIYSFVLVETEYLRNYLEMTDQEDSKESVNIVVEIHGDPLGSIYQRFWLGNYLVYSTGCCESFYWGMYDTKKRKNYLLAVCRDGDDIRLIGPCLDWQKRTHEKVLLQLLLLIEKNKLEEVSNDIYSESQKLIKEKGKLIDPTVEIIKEDTVMIFKPTKEFISLDIELEKEAQEFYWNYARATDRLNDTVYAKISRCKTLHFEYPNGKKEILVRKTREQAFGIAFFGKGKKPEIVYGFLTEREILDIIGEYFGTDVIQKKDR